MSQMLRKNSPPFRRALTVADFVPEDFEISQTEGSPLEVTIKLKADESFFFIATIDTSLDLTHEVSAEHGSPISTECSPGDLFQQEVKEHRGVDSFLGGVRDWVERIDAELKTRPLIRATARQQEEIDRFIDQMGDGDEFFSAQEGAMLSGRLDELERKLSEQVLKSETNKYTADAKIKELHTQIESLKARMDSLTKKGWAKVFGARMIRWAQRPELAPALGSGAAEATRGVLGPTTKALNSGNKE